MPTETVLLSLVGATPAVLTETVWCLATQPEPVVPERIIAITTSSGASRLKEKLFGDGHWERMKKELSGRGVELEGKLKFGPIGDSIRVFPDLSRSRELDDIRSAEDNEAVAEFFMELVRGFTENDSVELIVSIAGGRKTTSALLHSVMTLLGRAQDRINHILINDEWIFQPDFLYPGCEGTFIDKAINQLIDSKDAELQLVDVPFVPLRYLFKRDIEKSAGSFLELMRQVRSRTINVDDDLVVQLDTRNADIIVSGKKISLSAKEFLLYFFFVKRSINGHPPFPSFPACGEDLRDFKAECQLDNKYSRWIFDSLDNGFQADTDPRQWAHTIRKKLEKADFETYQINLLVPHGKHVGIELSPENLRVND